MTNGRASVRRRSAVAALALSFCSAAPITSARPAGGTPPPIAAVAPSEAELGEAAEWRVVRERWHRLRIAGVDCGWMRTATADDGERWRTETEMRMSLDRGGERVSLTTTMEFVETHQGVAERMRTVQHFGADPVETTHEFTAIPAAVDGESAVQSRSQTIPPAQRMVRRIVRQGGQETVGEVPYPEGEWLTPAAADRYFAMRRTAGAKEIVYRTVDGQQGLRPATVRAVRDGESRVDLDGRSVQTTRWRITTTAAPVETIAEFSADDILVRSRVDLGFGEMETLLSTEEQVKATRPGQLPDVIAATLVRPDRPIDDVMRSRRIEYRLSVPEGSALPDLPTAGAQRFVRHDPRTGRVAVDIDTVQPAAEGDELDPSYRTASAMIDSDDELIQTLLGRATRGMARATPAERAEACRAFVGRHVRDKDFGTAFASASEVARRREGDCSEHAVLLCAMLRADGVPARIASGLVYVEELGQVQSVFGWHLWTQALLESDLDGERVWRWVDLDATLPRTFHAGHILTAVTSLVDGPADPAMTSMLPLLGRLAIEVMEVTHHGATAPARRPPSGRRDSQRRRPALRRMRMLILPATAGRCSDPETSWNSDSQSTLPAGASVAAGA